MAKGLDRLIVSARDMAEIRRRPGAPTPVAPPEVGLVERARPSAAQEAAQGYLHELTASDERPSFRSFGVGVEPAEDAVPPKFVMRGERRQELTKTDVVQFEQVKGEIPVFGSRAVVEVNDRREFISAAVEVADVRGVDTEPTVSANEARDALAAVLQPDQLGQLPQPTITILPHPREGGALHLAWHFSRVPVVPPDTQQPPEETERRAGLGGCGPHNVMLEPSFDYFIDAHSGELIYLFPNSAHLDVPTRCRGLDEDGLAQTFFGRCNAGQFELENPFEDVRTRDLGLKALETTPLPIHPVQNATNNWQDSNPAAVSAHVNATRILDFLFRILRRNSIDDEGMTLDNIVNCFSIQSPNPPEWINAVWWKGTMWYGQQSTEGGGFSSLSRHLDIIGHELFHGVTETTADLVYEGLSGALNESISDIFGVIIRNWHLAPVPEDVSTWDWEIGVGLGAGGGPLRDMANPGGVGQWWKPNPAGGGVVVVNGYPDHMSQHVSLPITQTYDWGGVHWYSNIHNLAAHRVLTSRRADGSPVFTPEEVAVLYYLALTRLTRLSDFDDARTEVLAVADIMAAGDPARTTEAQEAIADAYDSVGIV